MASQVRPSGEGSLQRRSAGPRGEHNFETIFQIPPTHSLVQIRTRSRGGIVRGVYWDHEEYDLTGRLVARYRSFEEMSTAGPRQSGWRKFDGEGHLLQEGTLGI
jgi:hypothetical protein